MDVVTTSLEALIQRATNPQNEKPDIAAIEAFCVMLGKDSKGVQIASRLLSTHIQSTNENEALQALTLLDTCMKRCGRSFHAEIGKFRFLNVMIKLVSPKYLGNKTASSVRQKILELLYAWTRDYSKEEKIKETYEMLKKQGVIKESISPVQSITVDTSKSTKVKNPIFEDEEKTKLLQELLQSKDPFDLKLANKLIKSMVKDDEKRVQQNCQRNMELESVHNNVKLLSEMLDSYVPGKSSTEDVELMRELYEACERLKPTVTRLANESQDNDEMIGEVLAANDELTQVFEKYARIMVLARGGSRLGAKTNDAASFSSLLDFSSPNDATSITASFDANNKKSTALVPNEQISDIEMLGDIFSATLGNSSIESSSPAPDKGLVFSDANIMQPISIVPVVKAKESQISTVKLDGKAKALEDLNQLGETMLKQSLSQSIGSTARSSLTNVSNPNKVIAVSATPMYVNSAKNCPAPGTDIVKDLQSLSRIQATSMPTTAANGRCEESTNGRDNSGERVSDFGDLFNNDDDAMLDASSSSPQIGDEVSTNHGNDVDKRIAENGTLSMTNTDGQVKALTDINITIDNIKPGTIPPLTVIEEKNGISVVLHFAKGHPRPDVTVIVVTTMSKNSKALSHYLFQAVVPKQCKCRLLAPSGTELPAHNPFLPPSAITQIMLIANPQKEPVSLKFMLSYEMEDETFTEMGEVDKLPNVD